ncbi:3-isopropylmalate dehydratase small subunit [Prosthecodimorpha staleyi]|uniref:3-isopropylmalate dehydratase n=1 Tax=Prosthecodimorpha staleyi TaxID=2840188 RepID=A0A947D7H1_9HYPH|nr:3-isopropylmalate dehydratase small subunit [Prosthecodimorpha staleyi]MBT9291519.1 3-isopropylmalate dehydratase small subunit [Prosthecodimorpha staleyi]
MQPFTRLEARACPLGLANVDTDQLIPARFMSRPRSAGYGNFLLHDLRFGPDGTPVPGFVLDDPHRAGARILVARRNFGTGSSREAAVYALVDYGIGCVIAPSFGDIFASNAVKNGLLPATVTEDDAEGLLAAVEAAPECVVLVDLAAQSIAVGDHAIAFAIDPVRRLQLLNGWDDIDLAQRHAAEIAAFARTRRTEAPWIVPGHAG